MVFLGIILISSSTLLVFGDHGERHTIRSPNYQISEGVLLHEVQCLQGKTLVVKNSGIGAACVNSSTYAKLISSGWGVSVDTYNAMLNVGTAAICNTEFHLENGECVKDKPDNFCEVSGTCPDMPVTLLDPPPGFDSITAKFLKDGDYTVSFGPWIMKRLPNTDFLQLAYSIPTIEQAIRNDPDHRVKIISYDNESHNADYTSPPNELAEPAKYSDIACNIIKKAGYPCGLAPSRDLLLKEWEDVDWSNVDQLDMQLQRVKTSAEIRDVFAPIAIEAKRQNPNIQIHMVVNPTFNTNEEISQRIDIIREHIDGIGIVAPRDMTEAHYISFLNSLEKYR